ncbi:site-specific integrase [Macrococcus equipercicus]|uniref:Site-specific integrase n=1 Tax=Macrococcus equipercicus TaxID=69967 RepID=A0ABQ6R7T3_9STAP|nr:site-specific integrase [Macrococcus equipercicus]KAA1039153.1 site-specific integrase [Macrococcus equipercicus]
MKVYQRGKTWSYYFSFEGERKRAGGFKNKTEAKKAMTDKLAELQGGFRVDEKTPFIEYFDKWIDVNKRGEVQDVTLNRYINAKNVFEEKFGNIAISKVTQMMYKELLKEYAEGKFLGDTRLTKGRTTNAVNKLHGALNAAFEDAVYDGIITRNPAQRAKQKGKKASKPEEEKYMELDMYIKFKKEMLDSNELSHFLNYLLSITGGRFGEVQKLRYEHFDFKKRTVFLPGTKTDAAPRTIILLDIEIKNIKKFFAATGIKKSGYIFDTGKNLLTHNSALKVMQRFCLNNKLGNHTLHALRHTHCSALLHEGISIYYISKRLGHKSIDITMSTYSHLLKDTHEQEEDKYVAAMKKYS